MATSPPTYSDLREAGISHITRLAQQYWSDHNASDPGITLLEQLCFGMTDLGYRIDFDMPDLLEEGGEEAYSALFTAREILTTNPITFDDFRCQLIDMLGVENGNLKADGNLGPNLLFAPFSGELLLAKDRDDLLPEDLYQEVSLRGLWEVQVQALRDNIGNLLVSDLHHQLYDKLQANRALCTDFGAISIFDRQAVRVNLGVELGEGAQGEELLAKIYEVLDSYISPRVNVKELETFLKEQSVEEVFEGPALERGFLDKKDVKRFTKRADIRRSDLVHAVKRIGQEVTAVRAMNFALDNAGYVNPAPWILNLDSERAAYFDLAGSTITFYRGNLIVEVDQVQAKSIFDAKKEAQLNQQLTSLDLLPDAGRDREIAEYQSIRIHFPELYGVSPAGLAPQSDLAQQVSAKQLSGYLLFFEQILANLFSQLSQAWKLFTVDRTDFQSYFAQNLENIPAIADIYKDSNSAARYNRLLEAQENQDLEESRTNRFLDHLLSRFAESMTDYNLLMGGITHAETALPFLIEDKRNFVKNYPSLSSQRNTALNYANNNWQTENVSGLKKRISAMLGIDEVELGGLTGGKEGFLLLEHLLLRPRQGDEFQEHPLLAGLKYADPYSLQLSFIFPENAGRYGGLNISQKNQFKEYVKKVVRNETPAHIQVFVNWFDQQELSAFEDAFEAFLTSLAFDSQYGQMLAEPHQFALRIARDEILDILGRNMSPFPFAGIPYPLRDLPITEEVIASPVGNPISWAANIQLFYPQRGVTYVLTDRNRRPIIPRIAVSGDTPDGTNSQGTPFVLIPTPPNLQEDQTYWIRAEKNMLGKTNFVYMKTRVRVLIGIAPVFVQAIPPEINYGDQTTVQLIGTQAGVDYQLYDGTTVISLAPIPGDANNPISLATNVIGGIPEDLTIMVKGSRNSFITATDVGSVNLRVRANPNLRLGISSVQVPYNGSVTSIEVESDALNSNLTQASVTYQLLMQEIADVDFVHQKAVQPAASEVLEVIHSFGVAKVNQIPFVNWPTAQPGFTQIASGTVSTDGDSLLIDTSGISLPEDSRFLVLATKSGHADPVILHDTAVGGKLSMVAALIEPDTAPAITLNPSPITNGDRGKVEVANPQAGVKYFLRIGGVDQLSVFFHDQNGSSPRKDGIGTSKIGVDTVVGPPLTTPLVLQTTNTLTSTVSAEVIGEKVQTGVQTVIGTLSLTVV